MQYVIFDLDGTLVDSLDDVLGAINHTLCLCYAEKLDRKECMSVVGNGLKNALKSALMLRNMAFPPDEMQILNHELVSYYHDHYADHSVAYPFMPALLEELKEKGYKLAVLSNKDENLVKLIVKKLFAEDLFYFVGGVCDKIPLKPDKAALERVLAAMGVTGEDRVFYFGDSEVDQRLLNATGVRGGVCTWGFRTREALENEGCSILFDNAEELKEFIYGAD
jgi:Predicted phosphatases